MKFKLIMTSIFFLIIISIKVHSQVTDATATRQMQQMQQQQDILASIEPLDAPINPDKYLVGPGDILGITISGQGRDIAKVIITPEGKLVIPTVGTIDLRNLSLAEAKKKINNAISEKYIRSDVSVILMSLRKFRVTVAGQVENPGTVIMTAADRVSDAISKANMRLETQQSDDHVEGVSTKTAKVVVEVKQESAKRQILLTRKNGDVSKVDLLSYEIIGKKDKNPYLLEGDIIYVPLYTKNVPTVEVLGAVHSGGVTEMMEGDRVMDIIKLAYGFTYNADPANIEVSRFNSDHKTTTSIKIDLSNEAFFAENNIELRADDRIYVKYIPEYHRKNTAEIKGEIKYPGYYTVEYGKTKLSDVVKMAGGFTENASLKESFIVRRPYEKLIDPEFERLLEMSVNDMTNMEKEYFKTKSRERKGRIEIDFTKLFVEGDSTEDIYLKRNDYIEIARNSEVVEVSGKVKRHGLIPFKEGETVKYYIKQAGGYSWHASKGHVRIIRNETGDWVKANGRTKVSVGDTIFVPEKTEIKKWELFRDVLQSAYVIASFIWMLDRIQE